MHYHLANYFQFKRWYVNPAMFRRKLQPPWRQTFIPCQQFSVQATESIPHLLVPAASMSKCLRHVHDVHSCLERHGILKISLGFPDPRSRYLEELIVSLHRQHRHGLPITHSAARGWFWDVRPNDTVFQAQSHQARSETMREFPWHTDSSYERSPPRYFALHVIQPDRYGGGTLSVMNVERLSQLLSPDIQTTLLAPEFGITVPLEFIKEPDQRYIVGNLLAVNAHDQSLLVRFREDIVTPLSARAAVAFDELKAALHHLETLSDSTLHLTATDLPERSIILLDNYRWLHARNRIRDPARHLRRVRWNATPFPT